jgi:drug/metabolite transporter (DMT)-like permease
MNVSETAAAHEPASRLPLAATAQPLDALAAAIMLVLCLSWGFNQVAVKLALPEVPPFLQAAIRSAGGALIVTLFARWRGVALMRRDGTLFAGIIAGLLFGFEFLLIYRGLVWTTASRAVLFLYMAPFFVALGARLFLPGERLGAWQWLGLALSFLGVALALGVPGPAVDTYALLGDVMMIAAAALWAATTLVIKASALIRAPHEKTLLYQLAVSAPLMALAAVLFGEKMAMPSAVPLASLVYQTIWITSVTYVAWFWLIVRYSASRLSAFTFLTPLFGIAAGHLVLGEPITPAFAAAAAFVAAGLVLVNRR